MNEGVHSSQGDLMKRRAAILGIILTCSLTAQEKHLMIYNDNSTGNWTPPNQIREWKMTFSNSLGYRRDRQKLLETADHSVSYFHHFDTVFYSASLVCAWERLFLNLAGSYGWLANGDLNFKDPSNNFSTFKMGSGYSAEIASGLGCRIKFWTFHNGSLSFIPALGYIYSHFNDFPQGLNRSSAPAGTSGFTTMEYTRPIQQDWYGPYAEGRIAFSWKDRWRLDFYYIFRPIEFRQTIKQSISDFFFSPADTLTTAQNTLQGISSKSHTTRTHLGGSNLSYRSPDHWQLGVHFDGSSTWTHTARSIVHTKTESYLPVSTSQTNSREKLSIQWVRYSTNLFVSYWY